MASCSVPQASEGGRRTKFGKFQLSFTKLRGKMQTKSEDLDVHYAEAPHRIWRQKPNLSKSQSNNPIYNSQDVDTTRNLLSSSAPNREQRKPVSYKRCSPLHPSLTTSKSLPSSGFNKLDHLHTNTNQATQTNGRNVTLNKKKLTRSGQQSLTSSGQQNSGWNGDRFRSGPGDWRYDPRLGGNTNCNLHFGMERHFQFDDQLSLSSSDSDPEDHIYEEIDSDIFDTCEEEDAEPEENFLLSISLERRNNLKFYGCTGWDFGS